MDQHNAVGKAFNLEINNVQESTIYMKIFFAYFTYLTHKCIFKCIFFDIQSILLVTILIAHKV